MKRIYVVLDRLGRIYDDAPTIGSACELASLMDRIGLFAPYRAVEVTETKASALKVAA